MKRVLLVLGLVLSFSIAAMAQPNLRSSTLPAPFSSFSMNVCDTNGVVPSGQGTGQVWKYTSLAKRGSDTTRTIFTDKSVLKSPIKELYPNAEVVVVDDTTTYIYRTVTGQWRLEGTVTPGTQFVAGADPYDVRPSEIVFNGRKDDIFNGTFNSNFPTIGVKQLTGSHSYAYDGFGQLQLPDANYNNVARVTQNDTMLVEVTLGMQKGTVKTISRRTMWQEVTSNIPLLIIDESTIQVFNASNVSLYGPFPFKTVRYRRYGQTTGVNDDPTQSYLVAPCPSTGDHITVMGLHADPSNVVLINSIGQEMPCTITSTDAGIKIDVRGLAKGSYTLLVLDGQRMRTAGFVRY